jgi:hypothetical protein
VPEKEEISEDEFLRQQAELATDAIAESLDEVKRCLRETVRLRRWVRRYPLATVGALAAAGFAAATAVVPGRDETLKSKLSRLANRATPGNASAPTSTEDGRAAGERAATGKQTGRASEAMKAALVHSAFDLAKSFVQQISKRMASPPAAARSSP